MKLNELRIGNFVHHKAVWSYRQKEEPFIEFQFAWNESDWFAMGDCTLMEENIEFITITKQWLLSFGFVEVRDDIFRLLKNDDTIICTVSKIHCDKYEYELLKVHNVYFQYVHQLQNLHFALTGEELI